jgi:hypothetical protein
VALVRGGEGELRAVAERLRDGGQPIVGIAQALAREAIAWILPTSRAVLDLQLNQGDRS